MKPTPLARIAWLSIVALLVMLSCNQLTPSDSGLATEVARSIVATQTMEAEIQQRVQATLNAQTETPADESVASSGETIKSDDTGNFQVSGVSGAPIKMSLEDKQGAPVVGASILSAVNDEGVLLLVVPPPDTGLLPKFVFVNRPQGHVPRIISASTSRQSLITIHLDRIDDAPLIQENEVPPGLLEDLLSSPGWEKMVDATHNLCKQLSTLSTLGSVGYVSYGAARTLMATMSLKHLARLTIEQSVSIAGLGIAEGFIELCLAATGDTVGLTKLTGVVHKETGFGMIVLDHPIPFVVSGRITDGETKEPLEGVMISALSYQTKSLKDGTFYLSANASEKFDLLLESDGYSSQTVSVTPSKDGYAHLGDISLASAPAVFVEEFDDANIFSQTSDNVYVAGGKVVWNFSRKGGDQFVYRNITPFTGNYRMTVIGQIDDWTNNCRCGAGIGNAPGSGVAIHFGFFGGGCSTSGPVITTSGVSLNMQENSCRFTGGWPWINGQTPYKAVLTVNSFTAILSVEGVGQVDGTVDFGGDYSVLWVGNKGDGDWPSCSGSIESITVEPLK